MSPDLTGTCHIICAVIIASTPRITVVSLAVMFGIMLASVTGIGDALVGVASVASRTATSKMARSEHATFYVVATVAATTAQINMNTTHCWSTITRLYVC